jgi:glycosyltransferase involved in cell wall biosynthesis
MIKVAFFLDFPLSYNGGINYYWNVLYAIRKHNSNNVETYLFIPKDTPKYLLDRFSSVTNIISTNIVKRKSFLWYCSIISNIFLKHDLLRHHILKKININIVFNCYNFFHVGNVIKTINWIPDFQSIHYPNFYTKSQLKSERKILIKCLKNSNKIILSSLNSYNDLKYAHKDFLSKTEVVNFVSQSGILTNGFQNNSSDFKYEENTFFYLPNQFWNHKNHIVVFRALKILLSKNIFIKVVTTGSDQDFRGENSLLNSLKSYIEKNQLSEYVDFLGTVSYDQVLSLMTSSLAVINPSYFEGWSSTVEESKSINQSIILSDIPVHREQNPENGFYFNPDDEQGLSEIMESLINKKPVNNLSQKILKKKLNERTIFFSDQLTKCFKQLHDEKN